MRKGSWGQFVGHWVWLQPLPGYPEKPKRLFWGTPAAGQHLPCPAAPDRICVGLCPLWGRTCGSWNSAGSGVWLCSALLIVLCLILGQLQGVVRGGACVVLSQLFNFARPGGRRQSPETWRGAARGHGAGLWAVSARRVLPVPGLGWALGYREMGEGAPRPVLFDAFPHHLLEMFQASAQGRA